MFSPAVQGGPWCSIFLPTFAIVRPLIFLSFKNIKWFFIMVWVCISVIINEVKYLLKYWLFIRISSSVKSFFNILACFCWIVNIFLIYWYIFFIYYKSEPFAGHYAINTFFHLENVNLSCNLYHIKKSVRLWVSIKKTKQYQLLEDSMEEYLMTMK